LGAKAVLIGKAYLYGVAAAGEAGVDRVYAILRDETERVMKLIGCAKLSDLDASYVQRH
jgi:(S)-mandelate dehydrogenase